MGRFCCVKGVAFVGWEYSLSTSVLDSLKRVVSGVCGHRVDSDAKQ